MSDDRRLAVLRAIVQDYVETSEPVGSKALLERHQLGVSAATIRNDMAALEEEGLIAAPHTSAGRIPTDAGYRLFVDRLSAIKPMSPAERRAIAHFLDGAVDLDDIVDRTVRLLASLTHQVAVVQYPSLTRSTVRHIELVPIAASRLLVVLILNTGRVEQRVIETTTDLFDARRPRPSSRGCAHEVNAATGGAPLRRRGDRPRGAAGHPRPGRPRPRPRDRRGPRRRPRRGARGARRARRDGQPRPARRGLPDLDRPGARGPRGARHPAQAARRGPRPGRASRSGSVTRTRSPACTRPRWSTSGYGTGDRARRRARRRRPDPDGLPDDDGRGPRRSRPTSPGCSPNDLDARPPRRRGLPRPCPTPPKDCVRERLLRRPRRGPRRQRRRDQARLPQGRPPPAPGRQPRPGGGGAVQEGLPGLRRPLRPREAADLRHGRRPVCRRRARASARASPSATSWTRSSAPGPVPRAAARPAVAAQPGPGRAHPPRHRPRRRRVRRPEGPHRRHRRRLRHVPRRRHPAGYLAPDL